MRDEPTGHTIDGTPWEEPRPPHLPNALTGLSPWIFAFLILAGFHVLAGWLEWDFRRDLRAPIRAVGILLVRLPSVCTALMGAAIFFRHPEALRRLPMLVFGVALLNIVALLDLWKVPFTSNAFLPEIFPAFRDAGFPEDESSLILRGIYTAAVNVVSVFGLLYLARGLDGARRLAHVISGRALGITLTIVALGSAGVSLQWALAFAEADDVMVPLNVVALVMGLISMLAWSYLLVIAIGGLLAGERPRVGWFLIALVAGIEIAIRTLLAIGGLVTISEWAYVLLQVAFLAATANWVLLLLAFVAGVPSTATPDRPAGTQQDFGAG
jgi:hypothetical protein